MKFLPALEAPLIRRWGMLSVVVLLLGLVMAACSGGNQPSIGDNPTGKTVPPVMWKELVGVPPDKVNGLKQAMAVAAGQHDIGIVEGQFQSGTYSLGGDFRAVAQAGVAQVTYNWELRDDLGVLVETITGSEQAGPVSGGDGWVAVTPDVFQRIAASTSRQMASKFRQLGFAARTGHLDRPLDMPPAYLFAKAGPGASKEIDLETLNGPSDIVPTATPLPYAEHDMAMGAPEPAPIPEPPPPPEEGEANSGNVAIKVVAVVPVTGSPGGGNDELTAAMRRTLTDAGWPVVAAPRADALVVTGRVDLAKAVSGSQKVAVRWNITTPQGKSLGDVKQANSVPQGSLDLGWGPAAAAVAEAAAGGIFEIIQRYR